MTHSADASSALCVLLAAPAFARAVLSGLVEPGQVERWFEALEGTEAAAVSPNSAGAVREHKG